MHEQLTIFSLISLITLVTVYYFLITEKINKVIAVMLGGAALIVLQVFKTGENSSQTVALEFIKNNIDVLGFIIGMMVLVGIVKESGVFEALAIKLVKLVKGKPKLLLIAFGYLTLFMTAFLSNIPTVLILTPVLIVLVRTLKLPYLPFFFVMVVMANIGGAMTPLSDPTTYYQAKAVGLGFLEVVGNSGLIVLVLSVVTLLYSLFIFRKQLAAVEVNQDDIAEFDPTSAIKDRKILKIGLPILIIAILLMISREYIGKMTGITLDNTTITIVAAFLCVLIFKKDMNEVFHKIIDWEIIFFFAGLFIVVGALEHTGVIGSLAQTLVKFTHGNLNALLFLTAVGSGTVSTFIDNVPYNISMIGAIKVMAESGIAVYPLWWALNLGTSLGGAGSPIGAACNVIAFGQAEREKLHIVFLKYLAIGFPLVIINGLVTYAILWLRYIH
jgi:Na+/H+ antiporter NhaD/arsenite permease-like protein